MRAAPLAVAALSLTLAPTASAQTQDLVDSLASNPRFTTLVTAVGLTGLTDALKGPGPLTVFAPTDRAFAALPPATLNRLLSNPALLRDVLTYHVVADELLAADVVTQPGATSLLGQQIEFSLDRNGVSVNDSAVLATDWLATNGVIHVIDTVLVPDFSELQPTLLSTLATDGRFNTLVAAINAAGLTSALLDVEPLTVFAPTDRAFAALPDGVVAGLLNDVDALKNVLLYHVVAGELFATDVVSMPGAVTLQGQSLTFSVGSGVFVDMAPVLETDLDASNGVVHVLGGVLTPQ